MFHNYPIERPYRRLPPAKRLVKVLIARPRLSQLALDVQDPLFEKHCFSKLTHIRRQCYFDYINLHWYGSTFAQFQSHVQNAHSRFPNYQLIITEFALVSPATRDQQLAFLKSAMSFLDGASYVTMYSVFGASSPSLISANTGGGVVGTGSSLYNDDGSLSANGVAYRG
ncbi:hypothetical protein FRC09_011763 [Ceratobasidium sp. 395]|nr:hypothetical protein FRC09_011763 [Ceratobasidium sp. 395]